MSIRGEKSLFVVLALPAVANIEARKEVDATTRRATAALRHRMADTITSPVDAHRGTTLFLAPGREQMR
jgi:hypothetical protein